MKKRRTLIISLLLVAALALGIGYAGLSGQVTVNGKVKNKPHAVELVFVKDASVKITASAVGTDNGVGGVASTTNTLDVTDGHDTATFNVSDMAHKGDYITAHLKIKNNNQYDVVVGEPTTNYILPDGTAQFFTVTTAWIDRTGDSVVNEADLTLGHDEVLEFTVTITMIGEPTSENIEGDFILTVPGTGK